jgi:tetratricopeptide (TPR) repeat protein
VDRAQWSAALYRRELRQYDRALEVCERAIKQFPDEAANFHVERSNIYDTMGDKPNSERELVEALRLDPGHVGANNNLGYLLAQQGRDLQRALGLARKAAEGEQDNGGYRDSLGWAMRFGGWARSPRPASCGARRGTRQKSPRTRMTRSCPASRPASRPSSKRWPKTPSRRSRKALRSKVRNQKSATNLLHLRRNRIRSDL